MTKRRSRKDKLNAKHSFTIKWSPNEADSKNVKRQHLSTDLKSQARRKKTNNPDNKVEYDDSASTVKDMIKSLSIASLIIGLELMLYFMWLK
jgi:preprotein translocase subunit SecF